MKNKGFTPVIILLILVVVALMAVAYLAGSKGILSNKSIVSISSPTPFPETPPADPTANWKVYTNSKYGFSFRYPQEYVIKTSDEITGMTPFIVSIYPDSKLDKLLLTFEFDQAKANILGGIGGVKTEKPSEMPYVTLGTIRYPVIKYLFEEGVPGYGNCMDSNSSITYVANADSKLVVTINKQKEITCNPDGTQKVVKETTENDLTTANQILSTFKFTQ